MRKWLLVLLVPLIFSFMANNPALAAKTWNHVVDNMEKGLNQSLTVYKQGDNEKARDLVNEAYFGIFEKDGMERAVMSNISGKRASIEEYKISTIRKLMANKAPVAQVEKEIKELTVMLREDALLLDGKEENPTEVFLASLLIIVREGFEAILVIGAIIAYLIKSGNAEKTKVVYYSSVAAILLSFLTAFAFQQLFSISGANQEILEGATMLLAVVVLFSVSHWMVGKAEAHAWQKYIEGKVQESLNGRNTWSLAAAAFLAVYREGAETVLFYQALFSDSSDYQTMIWAGFGVGCVALIFIYALIRYGSVKVPLKPFFMGTSILMYVLAISFAGGGVKELQEAGVVGVTSVEWVETIDLLGIYPTVETLIPQVVLILLAIGGLFYQRRKNKPELTTGL
ncbi:FTR1 family iron permease|uniref:High-affinity iron transporter n=1 Tax=Dendrosporobacter quercicolus TaxID=146817 RepID=A0A1G9R018_9FIRM|nr:FTR1 family protein [Dendrosporobacter quercicolus]NSL48418.1 FTR1 family iron permease [Dendrosporobacter quercicolus DSM 1736]SDM16207.1 high-affinity iron transporter [Dendrosporobacter quercicolus]